LKSICIEDWKRRVDAVAKEKLKKKNRPYKWYNHRGANVFERLLLLTGKKEIKEVFPKFSYCIYGWCINYTPYQSVFKKT